MAEEQVHALIERYDPWTGRAWLEVRGTAPRRIPIGPGYAARRAALRRAWPDRPVDADWSDGRFWASPLGWPPYPVVVGGWLVAALAVAGGAAVAGGTGAAAVAVAAAWPLVRLLDAVHVGRRGVRVGPPWALVVPWHDVQDVGLHRIGRSVHVWVRTRTGAASGTVPPVLVPAVKARIRRLGGLAPTAGDGGLDVRYARWRAAANGLPWGVLAASVAAAFVVADPWPVLGAGLLVVAGLALLGAAVEARAGGWGTGAVLWLALLYAVVLAALSIGSSGWLS